MSSALHPDGSLTGRRRPSDTLIICPDGDCRTVAVRAGHITSNSPQRWTVAPTIARAVGLFPETGAPVHIRVAPACWYGRGRVGGRLGHARSLVSRWARTRCCGGWSRWRTIRPFLGISSRRVSRRSSDELLLHSTVQAGEVSGRSHHALAALAALWTRGPDHRLADHRRGDGR
jgi:hypothetical protein